MQRVIYKIAVDNQTATRRANIMTSAVEVERETMFPPSSLDVWFVVDQMKRDAFATAGVRFVDVHWVHARVEGDHVATAWTGGTGFDFPYGLDRKPLPEVLCLRVICSIGGSNQRVSRWFSPISLPAGEYPNRHGPTAEQFPPTDRGFCGLAGWHEYEGYRWRHGVWRPQSRTFEPFAGTQLAADYSTQRRRRQGRSRPSRLWPLDWLEYGG